MEVLNKTTEDVTIDASHANKSQNAFVSFSAAAASFLTIWKRERNSRSSSYGTLQLREMPS